MLCLGWFFYFYPAVRQTKKGGLDLAKTEWADRMLIRGERPHTSLCFVEVNR